MTLDICKKQREIETSTYQTVHQRFFYQVEQCNLDDDVLLLSARLPGQNMYLQFNLKFKILKEMETLDEYKCKNTCT